MIKKIMMPLLLGVLLSAAVRATAYAQADDPGSRNGEVAADGADPARRPRRAARGEITGVDATAGTFDLLLPNGETVKLATDDQTRYHGQVESFRELEMGMQAGVVVRLNPNGPPVALAVAVPPEGLALRRYAGEISAVDLAASSFTLEGLENGAILIEVAEHTRFLGQAQGLEDLETGVRAVVAARTTDDGSTVAIAVGVGQKQRVKRFAGEIFSVDIASSAFELQSLKGDRVNILVDGETQFRSADGAIEGIDDLNQGMQVGLGAIPQGDRLFLAKVVVVGRGVGEQLDLRARGTVTSLDPDSLTMRTRDDREIQVRVDDATKYLSRDGSVEGLADLVVGMEIVVGAVKLDSGELMAKVVAVVPAGSSE